MKIAIKSVYKLIIDRNQPNIITVVIQLNFLAFIYICFIVLRHSKSIFYIGIHVYSSNKNGIVQSIKFLVYLRAFVVLFALELLNRLLFMTLIQFFLCCVKFNFCVSRENTNTAKQQNYSSFIILTGVFGLFQSNTQLNARYSAALD